MKNWLKEPLVHFIVLGGVLFIVHALWTGARDRSDYTIIITPEEMARQATLFAGENRRQPTDEDIQSLLFAHVEEQVLSREAQRLGLDMDDTIIRRRLAQKMRFMIQDAGVPALPTDADLQSWFNTNQEAFTRPERRSFSHIYLSPKSRDDVQADAKDVLTQLPRSDWQTLGDPFMNPRDVKAQSFDDIRKDYGTAFAKSVFELNTSTDWQGPIASAFGLHLVRINDVTAETMPDFSEVRDDVEDAWLDEAERAENTRALKTLIDKYDVVVED